MIGEDGRPLHSILLVRTACRGWSETQPPREAAHGNCYATAVDCGLAGGQAVDIFFASPVKELRRILAHDAGIEGARNTGLRRTGATLKRNG